MAFGRYVMEGAVGWETVFLVGSPLCNPTIFRFSELHPGAVWQWRQDSNFDGEQRAQSSAPCPMIYPGCRLANSIRPAFPKTDTLHRCLPTSPLVCRLLLLLFHGAHRGDAQALMVDALADKRLYEQELARMRKENAFLEDQARGRHVFPRRLFCLPRLLCLFACFLSCVHS